MFQTTKDGCSQILPDDQIPDGKALQWRHRLFPSNTSLIVKQLESESINPDTWHPLYNYPSMFDLQSTYNSNMLSNSVNSKWWLFKICWIKTIFFEWWIFWLESQCGSTFSEVCYWSMLYQSSPCRFSFVVLCNHILHYKKYIKLKTMARCSHFHVRLCARLKVIIPLNEDRQLGSSLPTFTHW